MFLLPSPMKNTKIQHYSLKVDAKQNEKDTPMLELITYEKIIFLQQIKTYNYVDYTPVRAVSSILLISFRELQEFFFNGQAS